MPLFTFPPAPLMLRNDGMITTTNVTLTGGAIYFCGIELFAPVTVAQMRTEFGGSPTGNVDMGIYDATGTSNKPGTLLCSTGAVSATGTGGTLFTQNLANPAATYALSPGRYWLAIIDSVGDSVAGKTGILGGLTLMWRSTGTSNSSLGSVGSSAPSLQATTLIPQVDGLISGSFS